MFLTRAWFQKRSRWTRQPKDLDPLEVRGVLAPTELESLLRRERARVDRNHQCFSLVVFRVDERRDGDLRRVAEILVERVRAYDSVGLVEEGRMAALLPETDGDGSWTFADGVMGQLAEEGLRATCEVYSYPGRRDGGSDLEGDYGRVPRKGSSGTSADEGPTSSGPSGGSASGVHSHSLRTGTDGLSIAAPAPTMSLHAVGEIAPEVRDLPENVAQAETRPVQDLMHVFVEPLPRWRRVVDVLASGTAIALLSPVLVTTAALVKLTSPGPIIFSQLRVGRGGRTFRFYKFRSMYVDAEERKNELRLVNEKDGPIFKMREDPRITPLGRWIRRLSIDELPQLFNVLKGDMTLVGPRPPIVDEVEHYQAWQRQRLDITGGLTCIWQVSGRSEVSFDDWMRMDIRYKQKRTLRMDAKLLWKTIGAVFSGRGAY